MRAVRFMVFARSVTRWLIAIAVGIIGVLIQQQPGHLADPTSCPGLLEWIAIAAIRSGSRLQVAAFLTWLNVVGVFFSLVALTRWIERAAGGPVATAAVSAGAAVTLATTPVFAPSHVLAVGAASAAWLALDNFTTTRRRSQQLLASIGLGAAAAIAPPLALPLAAAAVWFTWQTSDASRPSSRAGATALAALIVLIWPIAVTMAIPALPGSNVAPGCLVPTEVSGAHARRAVTQALSGTGPLPLALAVLAAFSLRDRRGTGLARASETRPPGPYLAVGLLPLVATSWAGSDPARTLAPAIAGFWWMAAAGMREVVAALAARPAWRIGAWILAALLPLLQWSHRSTVPVPPADESRGHETLTRRGFSQLLNALPTPATLVVDDAISDLLLRSTARRIQQSGKVLHVIPRDGRDAARAAVSSPVFAMPRAQFELQHQGLTRTEAGGLAIPGLVSFTRAGECTTVESQWRQANDLSRSTRLAVVSDRPDARGPVIIYLGADLPFDLYPIDWPAWTTRGYHAGTFDRSKELDRLRLEHDRSADGVPTDDPLFESPFLGRLELWRVPDGPMILAVGLGQSPKAALIRGTTPGDRGSLRGCPSFPGQITRLEGRRPD